jgi:hypothetical protein
MTPENRMLPNGFEPAKYTNLEAYESLAEDPDVLYIGDRVDPTKFNGYLERKEKIGWEVTNLLMWHKNGVGYSIFPVVQIKKEQSND